MNKKIFSILILLTVVLFMGISCKSAPPAPTPQARPTRSAEQVRAEEARQRAMDFEAPSYFPSEWEAAEAQFRAQEWEPATEAYDELFKKAVPLYAQAREDEIMAIRDEIKASGFADEFPEYLKSVDDVALAAYAQYEAEDYYGAKSTAAQALSEYNTLLVGAKAYQTRREIIDRGFRDFDPENFDRADEIANVALSEYDSGNKQAALTSAEEALLRYNLVLATGWANYAAERRIAAARERELALAEKANIASREFFREADAAFTQAEKDFESEDFRSAGLLYINAESRFVIARQDTETKRIRAEEAIRLAEEKIIESNEAAIEAERLIEGGVR